MDFIDVLEKRNLLCDFTPEVREQLKERSTAYLGVDPTSKSLHVGHLASLLTMKRLKECGHRPIILIGGATSMVGDPSGKSDERKLLFEEELEANKRQITEQIRGIVGDIEIIDNLDWFEGLTFIDFIRDVGKHITVNYMQSKESVKNRIDNDGISFTEFSYQLMQAHDFCELHKKKNCKIQIGGSDQWGNITTGIELINKKLGEQAHGITINLLTDENGNKFGKTDSGDSKIWLNKSKTTPYDFYQFWINLSDNEAIEFIKVFSFKDLNEIEDLIQEHQNNPSSNILQKQLAYEMTELVHSNKDAEKAKKSSEILYGKNPIRTIKSLSEEEVISIFIDVPHFEISHDELKNGEITILDVLYGKTNFVQSKSKAKRCIEGNSVKINGEKITDENKILSEDDLIANKYIVAQSTKKNKFLLVTK